MEAEIKKIDAQYDLRCSKAAAHELKVRTVLHPGNFIRGVNASIGEGALAASDDIIFDLPWLQKHPKRRRHHSIADFAKNAHAFK